MRGLKHLGVAARKIGMLFPKQLSFDDWRNLGEHVFLIANSSSWWIGDWLVFGQAAYPDRYRRALAESALDYQTLRNYAWVARRVPLSRRRDNLSFQHHAEVASLPPDEQEYWLERAEAQSWSRNQLRANIRAGQQRRSEPDAGPETTVRLSPTRAQGDRWAVAATLMNLDLDEWATRELDRAASKILNEENPRRYDVR